MKITLIDTPEIKSWLANKEHEFYIFHNGTVLYRIGEGHAQLVPTYKELQSIGEFTDTEMTILYLVLGEIHK